MVLRHILIRAFVSALALLAAGCEKSAPELLAAARDRHARGDNRAAIIHLKNALVLAPKNAEAQLLAGRIHGRLGNLLEAERALRTAQQLGASAVEVLPVLGPVLLEMEQFGKLLEEVKPAAAWPRPAQAEAALLRANAQLGLRALSEAGAEFDRAEAELPEGARIGRARLAAVRGEFDAALQGIDAVLALFPASADARVFRGDLLHAAGRNDESLAAYREALKGSPDLLPALLGEAQILTGRREYAAARIILDRARSIAPASPSFHFSQAFLALQQERYAECQESLLQVFRVIPQHGPSTLLSGALLHATGNYRQAQQVLVGFLSRVPGSIIGRKLLAATLIKTGQPQSAVYVLGPILEQNPDPVALSLAAEAYMDRGQTDKAQPLLERAAAINPGSATIRTGLGVAHLAIGNEQRGIAELEAAVRIEPDSSKANQFLVTVLIGQNRLDEALAVVNRLTASLPDHPGSHQLSGAVHLARRDEAKAEAAFRRALALKPAFFPAAAALAQMRLRNKDPDGARGLVEAVLAEDPRNLDALLLLADLDLAQGKRGKGEAALRKAIEMHPQSSQAFVTLAELQWAGGERDEALSILRWAQQFAPRDPRVLGTVGRLLAAKGDRRGAVEAFSKLVGILPNSVPAMLQLAAAHSAAGEHTQAISQALAAETASPGNIEAMTTHGLVLLQAGRYAETRAQAQAIQRRDARDARGHALEGDALMAEGNHAAAIKAYERADAIRPTGAIRVKLHQAHVLVSGSDAGGTRLLEWIRTHPKEREPRHHLAEFYLSTKRPSLALEHYEILLEADPKDSLALNNAALALEQLGDAKSLEFARKAYSLKPDDPAIMDTLGILLVASGDLIRGIELLRRAVVLAPDIPVIRLHLAQAHARSGDTDRARRELTELLARNRKFPEAPEARELLGRLAR